MGGAPKLRLPRHVRNGTWRDVGVGKHASFTTFEYSAMVAYAGLASFASLETHEWLNETLLQEGGSLPPLAAVLEAVKRKATEVVRQAAANGVPRERRALSFTVGAVVGEEVSVHLISNYQRMAAPPYPTPRNEMSLTSRRRQRKPLIVVTGLPEAVSRDDICHLREAFSERDADMGVLQSLLGDVNMRAARQLGMDTKISEACWVQTITTDQRGGGRAFGKVPGGFAHMVMGGMDLPKMLIDVVDDIQAGRIERD